MTLHRSALLFYLLFPAFYRFIPSSYPLPNTRFTLSSFHLSNIQEDILISYSFTFLTSKKLVLNFYPSIFLPSKLSFFTFAPSPFHVQSASSNKTSPPLEGLGEAASFGVKAALFWYEGRPLLVWRPLLSQPNIPQRGTRHKPIEVHMSLYATHFASFRELPDVMSACTFYLWTTRIVLSKEKKVRIEAWSKM